MMTRLFTILFALLTPVMSISQTIEKFSIDSGGLSVSANNIAIIYTLGEVNVNEVSIDNFQLSAGFINPENESGTLSIVNNYELDEITLYPNPAKDVVHIISEHPISKIEVYGLKGEKLITKSEVTQINCSHLASGMYLIHISTNKTFIIKRLIINK